MEIFSGGSSYPEHQQILTKLKKHHPCWCGSKKKYKHCHFKRQSEKSYPYSRLKHEVLERSYEECLHPHASHETCNKIIDAHTIQRNGPLKSLAKSHHLYRFDLSKAEVEQISLKQASTFRGYCKSHDQLLFEPIENRPSPEVRPFDPLYWIFSRMVRKLDRDYTETSKRLQR